MSKKSRKRNKKILAAIGLGLGAAALASKKKAALASTEDGKGGIDTIAKAKQSMTKDNAYKLDSKKKETPIKKNIPQTTKVNTGPKKSTLLDRIGDRNEAASGMQFDEKLISGKLPKRNNRSVADSLDYNSTFNQNKRRNAPVTGTTLPGQSLRSGGRAGYKSGGKIKKSMGKALRGGGKVIR